jgi:asparagine synthase (glutamine-hydrolysing)
MCGICGFVNFAGHESEEALAVLRLINSAQHHRGPDSDGYFVDSFVALAMKRLAIIDVEHGQQPIESGDGRLQLIFNGEIYNFNSIRDELKSLGISFKTRCDSEVILQAYIQWGHAAIQKLEGMFAIAIWDQAKKELFLSRDRLGKKPLHFCLQGSKFGFASEIKSLLRLPWVEAIPDYQTIDAYLRYKYFPGNTTPYQNIRQVPPGTSLIISSDKKIQEIPYWDIRENASSLRMPETYREVVAMTRELVEQAVCDRMISDVPLGAFLSGGIDSSIITGTMAKFSSSPVKTFCMGFKESSFDERKYAAMVAKKWATDHHEFEVEIDSVMDLIHTLVQAMDSPFGDSGAIPNYLVCRETAGTLKVALSGLGADEAFAGYERYWVDKLHTLYQSIPRWLRGCLIEPMIFKLPVSKNKKSVVARGKAFLNASSLPLEERYMEILSVFSAKDKQKLYTDNMRTQATNSDDLVLVDLLKEGNETDFIQRAFVADTKSILLNDYELITDRVSMAHSLEVRAPFLDHRLMEFCYQLPSHFKLKGFRTKSILRDAFEDVIPAPLLQRGKFGFESSFSTWVREDLFAPVREILVGRIQSARALFDTIYIDNLLNEHRAYKFDHSKKIFALLTLELWFQQYID